MKVTVDNIWASPTTLHMRVHVWVRDEQYRVKQDVAVPLDEVPLEALRAMWAGVAGERDRDAQGTLHLF